MVLTSLSTLVFVYISLRNFFDGAGEFLIQPTAWYYMEFLGESHLFLGFTLGAFSAAALLSAPCFGYVDVRFGATKLILIMAGIVKFLGNLLYAIPINGYFALFGRLLSGIGEGTVGALYGTVAKYTTEATRARAFLYFESLFSIGTIFGPLIGSSLTFNLNVYGWEINPGNSPALILTIIWFPLLVLTAFLPSDLGGKNSRAEEDLSTGSVSDDNEFINKQTPTGNSAKCLRSKVLCLYFIIFQSVLTYNITSFYTPLLARHRLGLELIHIKLLYLNAALSAFIVFLSSYIIVTYISEKKCLVVFIASQLLPVLVLLFFALSWDEEISSNAAYLLLIALIFASEACVTFPLVCSMVSCETPTEHAPFYQSVGFTVAHSSIMISRFLAGGTFNRTAMAFTAVALTMGIFIELLWFSLEYRNLFPTF